MRVRRGPWRDELPARDWLPHSGLRLQLTIALGLFGSQMTWLYFSEKKLI